MTSPEEQEELDRKYLEEWDKWWSQLSPGERARYEEQGITGPELTTYTTKKADFDADRVTKTTGQISAVSAKLLPDLESIWESDSVPEAIVGALGDLGSPFHSEFKKGQFQFTPELSPLLRIVLEIVQTEPVPGMALAVILKWFGSDLVTHSDRKLEKIFGQTFQDVSICRKRLEKKFGCEINAGKSKKASGSYKLSNRKKTK